ncbi:MAG: phosphate acetyltransferase [Clostridia bacterium]|nr:phosphate acetyltransferase [Clostridia bacterium]
MIAKVWDTARRQQRHIVLPEAENERILQAAKMIVKENLAKVILIGSKDRIHKAAKKIHVDIDEFIVVEPEEKLDAYSEKFYELRKGKITSIDEARKILTNNLYLGAMMVKLNDAHGMIAGASHTTAEVLRPTFQIIKTIPGIRAASSYFAMIIPDCPYGEEGFLIYADSAVIPNPTAEELADIAIASCLSIKEVFGIEKEYCALVCSSTKGSCEDPIIDKVIRATEIAKEKRPDLLIDGELQADTALVREIGREKSPNSPVAGKANILIFPDLNSGNIAYKLTERLAKAEAYGPVIQGLERPMIDLSRGCKATDIVNVAAIVAAQATDKHTDGGKAKF